MSIRITSIAHEQVLLMLENDYTISDNVLRISVDGKECHGFTYAFGFDMPKENDLVAEVKDLRIHLDPFAASIFKNGEIDYLLDPSKDLDGFVLTNDDEKNFQGKFFKDESKIPVIEA